MRRSVLLLTPLLPLALWACEDGPNQTFAPATGNLFNNGDTTSLTDDAGDPLNANYGGSSKTEICSGGELQAQWSKMIAQPILPPYKMAGMDLSGGPKYPIMTIEQAEYGPLSPVTAKGDPNPSSGLTRLCQPTVEGTGPDSGDLGGSLQVHWGNNAEVQLEWAIPTHKAYVVNLNPGYVGQMNWQYKPKFEVDGKTPGTLHSYTFQLSNRIQRDGVDFPINWTGGPGNWSCSGKCEAQVDEFYRGIVSSFTPELYTDTLTDCKINGTCGIFPPQIVDGVHPIIGFRPAAFYIYFQDPGKNAGNGNLVYSAYAFAIKFPPYGLAATHLKMDNQGPFASTQIGNEVGTTNKCVMQLGQSFAQLEQNCIQVFDATTNVNALNKVIGGIAHDDQKFLFNVVAVNQNYFPKSLSLGGPRQFDVIHDGETPADHADDNIAGTYTYDVRASGPIVNDGYFRANGSFKKDYHGSGAVWREYGRMAHERLAADYAKAHPKPADAVFWPRAWHDSQCYFPMQSSGTPSQPDYTCDNIAAQTDCTAVPGCAWDATQKACTSTTSLPVACTSITTKTACASAAAAGCGWDGVACQGACLNLNEESCAQAKAHGMSCQWTTANGGECTGIPTPPATCAGIPFGLTSYASCSWGLPKPGSCASQAPSSCVGGAECTGLQQVDCVATHTAAGAICRWDDNGSTAACNAHAAQGACVADTANHCNWWTTSLAWRAPDGCTGLEGMIDASASDDQGGNSGPDDMFAQNGANVGNKFTPGNPLFQACNDPGVGSFCGDNGDTSGLDSDLLGGPLTRELQYMGRGDINNLPLEGRDLRFFFKMFTEAFAKYVSTDAAATAPGIHVGAPVPDFHNAFIDTDYLIFDSFGGNASRSEYVNYAHAGETDQNGNIEDPTDVEEKILLIGSNLQSTSFYRLLDREERALFEAMALDAKQPAWAYLKDSTGKPVPSFWTIPNTTSKFNRVNANMFLSNVFGSNALGGVFSGPVDSSGNPKTVNAPAGWVNDCKLNDTAPIKDAYYCATYVNASGVPDDADCPLHAPTDDTGHALLRDNGKPLLADYCGVFYPTAFALGGSDGFELDGAPDLLTETQKVKYTHYANPYDNSTARTQIEALVPWKSAKEGVGYPVVNLASPSQDVFVETSQLDLTGQVVTPVIDYNPVTTSDDAGVTHTLASIQAVETQDYLGDVFLCVDPATAAARAGTHRPGDILTAHMYTSVQTILDWIASHPGVQDACGIVIRYSPFNNYPDVIQGTTAGVRLNIEQGAGFGRVSDVTIFSPGTGSPSVP